MKAQQKILEVKKAEITELKSERTVEFRIANRKVRDRMKRAPIMNYMVRKLRSSA